MDTLTHTLFALTLGRTSLGRAGRGTTTALVLASNAPDIDIVALAGGTWSYLKWHRGPTHGLLGVLGLGLLVAALVWAGQRAWDRRHPPPPATTPASFAMLTAIAILAVALHVLMDLPTSYGTRLLSPWDWRWFSLDWMPIIDIYLWIALGAGLLLGRNTVAARRRNATLVLVFMAANYGVRAASHTQAIDAATSLFGPLMPQPCAGAAPPARFLSVWPPRPSVEPAPARSSSGGPARCMADLAAMPNFTSPFRWRLVAQTSDAYELHDIDLLDRRFTDASGDRSAFFRLSIRYPNLWTPPVLRAAGTELGRVYLGFSRFPAARSVVEPDGFATVRWSDMRFVGGLIGLDQTARQTDAFTATIRMAPDGAILRQTLGP